MKLKELFENDSSLPPFPPLKLNIDNPGGSWLEGKRKSVKDAGLNQFGFPLLAGTITGYWNRSALLPVSVVAKLKGRNGEHLPKHTRQDSLDYLHKEMGDNNRLPLSDSGKQYAPFINIFQDGEAFISEGNHRIKAAKQLGWKYIPVQMYYYNGGEEESGPLTPTKVKEYDAQAIKEGYSIDDFKGNLK